MTHDKKRDQKQISKTEVLSIPHILIRIQNPIDARSDGGFQKYKKNMPSSQIVCHMSITQIPVFKTLV